MSSPDLCGARWGAPKALTMMVVASGSTAAELGDLFVDEAVQDQLLVRIE
jgi:hypothetical protein